VQKPGFHLIPAIFWLIISTILLTLPGSAIPKADWLDKIWIDKWAHIGMFFMMVFLLLQTIPKKKQNTSIKTTVILVTNAAFLYGIGIEFIKKYFIPDRSFDILDIAADAIGCGLGMTFWLRNSLKK